MSQTSEDILGAATVAPTTGKAREPLGGSNRTFHGTVIGTGTVSATIEIYASNYPIVAADAGVGQNGILLTTLTLSSGTSPVSSAAISISSYRYYWAKLTAISGTSAVAYCYMAATP